METIQAIKTRRSVRRFADKAVEGHHIKTVIEAGMCAPSSGNARGWEFIVINDPEKKEELMCIHDKNRNHMNAPIYIIICYDLRTQKLSDRWFIDSAAAAQNMVLAAHDVGLGALWLDIYPDKFRCDSVRMSFNIPDNVMPFCILCLGHPKEVHEAPERFDESRIHTNQWKEH